ncbi:hypothetical protein BURMUCGD2M_6472 [Burkholderia multivorans CGD2M]|uniref:Uncharacterized protein n=1 Tax=Burkholderia multivorans CGD2 TaxID=513052 RepID=B9BP61_9BURK|nr:hypothetical protein BURMUCGD2_6482 [Burkholderia multivorans CGD2]EEE13750.1 hypothetical protein BURMUCGD2M_6472 [Burkholderia multivorans CGD2M]
MPIAMLLRFARRIGQAPCTSASMSPIRNACVPSRSGCSGRSRPWNRSTIAGRGLLACSR